MKETLITEALRIAASHYEFEGDYDKAEKILALIETAEVGA